jgi:adenylate cyclase class 2
MKETEIKFKVESFDPVREKIEENRGTLESSFFEDNMVFDDRLGTLFNKKFLLRLRKSDKITLTLKKPVEKVDFKVMEEHEIEVSDLNETHAILASLGYERVFRYQKNREIYDFENTKICLDQTPIGNYLEIEGEKPDIKRVMKILEFTMKQGITKNYLELFEEYCRNTGSSLKDMIF